MVTPPTGTTSPEPAASSASGELPFTKRKASRELEAAHSASPYLQGNRKPVNKMQRTPQANLTQTKLTGFGIVHGGHNGAAVQTPDVAPPPTPVVSMEVSPKDAGVSAAPATQPITAEFLLRALRENKEDIVRSFNANINALAKRVDQNNDMIREGVEATKRNTESIYKQQTEIEMLTTRISTLEAPGVRQGQVALGKAKLSDDYLAARRSVRLWPVAASREEELWEGVGNFLHELMGISEEDMNQDDRGYLPCRGTDSARQSQRRGDCPILR